MRPKIFLGGVTILVGAVLVAGALVQAGTVVGQNSAELGGKLVVRENVKEAESTPVSGGGNGGGGAPTMVPVEWLTTYKYVEREPATAETTDGDGFLIHVRAHPLEQGGPLSPTPEQFDDTTFLLSSTTPEPYQEEWYLEEHFGGSVWLELDEVLADGVNESNVLPADAECRDGMYRLSGYSLANSLAEAVELGPSPDSPVAINKTEPEQAHKHLIVWNEKCPPQGGNEEADDNDDNSDSTGDNGGGVSGGSSGGGGGEVLPAQTPEETPGEVLGAVTCAPYLSGYIKYGGSNNRVDVSKLQAMLNRRLGARLPITGYYGPKTLAMVNLFQMLYRDQILEPWVNAGLHQNEFIPTGQVYKTTRRWINMLECPGSFIPMPSLP